MFCDEGSIWVSDDKSPEEKWKIDQSPFGKGKAENVLKH